jgi:diguanylate cyclase (GGDEF)-like protein/PAS domain S-box-containing protein
VLGVLLSVATIVLFLTDLQARYNDRISSAKRDARNFATVLAEQAALTFEDVDRALRRAEDIRKTGLAGGHLADPAVTNAALRQLQRSSSILVAIGWTDASGDVVAHSYDHALPRRNLADMAHFIAQRDSAEGKLFVSPPYHSATADRWLTAASRRLSNPDGSFAGIVTAPLDPSYFAKLYRSIDLTKGGTVLLLHSEGLLVAREPELKSAIGKSFAGGPLLTKLLPMSDTGALEVTSPIDGLERIVGYKAVPGLPLVVIVTYARSEVLEPWYRHLVALGLLVFAIVIVILFGTFVLVRQTNALAVKSQALEKTNARFDAALSNMPHGLSMFDADGRLLVCNSRYCEMYDLTEDQVRPGTPLRQIMENYKIEGADFDLDVFLEGAKQRTSHLLTLADGRMIAIRRTPMKDGGWVATHEDITEKRRADTLVVENAAKLKRINDRFDAAISNMSQGLCLFDADKRLVISNKRYQEMYRLPDELVLPGTPLSLILQHYADRGEATNLTVDQHVQLMPTLRKQEFEPVDGRKIFIQRKPLPDGGWVATHEDVTEQKRSEQLLAEKAAELEAMNVRFDAALNNMSQGLCLFDGELKVVVSNARYADIYHLDRGLITPGTTLEQVFAYRRQQGTNFCDPAPASFLAHEVPHATENRELADGRTVAVSRQLMPDGGWLTTHDDITERARNERRIAYLAQHDLLTGLANRALFSEKLDEAAKRLQRHGTIFTVLMLDLDRFKQVNDTLGHPAGDQLLVEVAQRLKSSLRDTDVVARLGGDEFAIIQENEKDQREGAILLARRIVRLIEKPFDIDGHQVNVGASIGIAFAPEHGNDAEGLLKKADLALYAVKSGGRNDFRVFEPELTEAADAQKSIEIEFRGAISRHEFELHYQPIVDARTRRICAVEAFVRWHHPEKGMLAPDQFLPLAESSGLIVPLGEWIVRQACLDAAAWPPHIQLAVNISAVQFTRGNLLDVILPALADSGLSPDRLQLEIADVALLEAEQARHLPTIQQLKNLGVSIVLDGCGVGYTAAGYLTSFPFDKIKIDRPLSQGFASRRDHGAVVASVVALAHGLGIAAAAKGVESPEQFDALQAVGVDFAQGYLFGRPVTHCELDLDAVIPAARNVA